MCLSFLGYPTPSPPIVVTTFPPFRCLSSELCNPTCFSSVTQLSPVRASSWLCPSMQPDHFHSPCCVYRGEGPPSIPGLHHSGSFLTEQHSLRLARTTATGDASTSSEMSLLGAMPACNLSHPALETVGPIRLALPLPSLPWLSIPNAGVSQVLCTSRYFYKDPLVQRVAWLPSPLPLMSLAWWSTLSVLLLRSKVSISLGTALPMALSS